MILTYVLAIQPISDDSGDELQNESIKPLATTVHIHLRIESLKSHRE